MMAEQLSGQPEFVIVQHVLHESLLDALVEACDKLIHEAASTLGRPEARVSQVGWFDDTGPDVAASIRSVVQQLNDTIFHFDIGMPEPFQYTVYPTGGRYDWHMDKGRGILPRKLSFTLQLSDSHEYKGGDLELMPGDIEKMPRTRGTAVVFPSYLLHRVTPVTSGVRKSLVGWFGGPPWK